MTPMSREMLRAARAGCRYIRPTPKFVNDEEKDPGDLDDAMDVTSPERSFTARKWSAIPRHIEPPEVEFLAKRRPGLPSLYGASTLNADPSDGTGANAAPPLRKTKIKKVDPASGTATIYEVWVPEGHTLEGEVHDSGEPGTETSEGIMILPTPAPGTVVEGVGVVNQQGNLVIGVDGNAGAMPVKRRPPPPKRKGRGGFANRGRRKKVMFAHGESAGQAPETGAVEGNPPAAEDVKPSLAPPEENLGASQMSVDSAAATPDNRAAGEDEEEEHEEDEESDDGEEGEVYEGDEFAEDTKSPGAAITNNPSETAGIDAVKPEPQPETGNDISEQTARVPSRDLSSSPDLPLATESANRKLSMDRSPVKETHPQPPPLPSAENPAPSISPPVPAPATTDSHLPPRPNTEPEPEPKTESPDNQNPSPPEPAIDTETNPDAMEGVVHHSPPPPPTGLASLPPRPPAPEQSSEPPPPTSTTPAEAESDEQKSASAPDPPVHFDDGEVDLLGSLEASLGGGERKEEGGGDSAAPAASAMEEEQKVGDGEAEAGEEVKAEEAQEESKET